MRPIGKGEYADILCRYFQSSFPKVAKVNASDLLEIITGIMIGSKDLRYGPVPKPESLVTIRKTIKDSISLGLPIPVLIPWGGRKMDVNLKLDVAEVSAIRQVLHVDEHIRKFYPPGLLARVRIEDINASWLYNGWKGVSEYSSGMVDLIDILKGDTKILGIRETDMMDTDEYHVHASHLSTLLYDVLRARIAMPDLDIHTIPAFEKLEKSGWKGEIPREQVNYYMERYRKLYPDDHEENVKRLADYFAGSKARYDLNGRGNPKTEVGSYIQINFAHPVPGAPEGLFNNTLYYRTVPESWGRTHVAPWRGKGYLQIVSDVAIPKVTFTGNIPESLVENSVRLVSDDGEKRIDVETDFVYVDAALIYTPAIM